MDASFQPSREQLSALLSVSRLLTSSIDLPSLLKLIVTSVTELLECEASSLFLIDRTGEQLVLRVATGPVRGEIKELRLEIGEGIAGWVAKHRKSLIVNDPKHDPRFLGTVDKATGFQTRSILAVPLMDHNQVVGVLEIQHVQGQTIRPIGLRFLDSFWVVRGCGVEECRVVSHHAG